MYICVCVFGFFCVGKYLGDFAPLSQEYFI